MPIEMTRKNLAMLAHNIEQNEAELIQWQKQNLAGGEPSEMARSVHLVFLGQTHLAFQNPDLMKLICALASFGLQVVTQKMAVEGKHNRYVPDGE